MRRLVEAVALAAFALAGSGTASGQAWVQPGREGTITIAAQTIDNTGHRLTDGSLLPEGKSRDAAVFVEADYAFTDRFSVAVGLPLVFAKYLGPRHDPEPPMVQAVDSCYCWQHGLQDLSLTARVNLANGATAGTASLSYGLPSHDYDHVGEAVVGRGLPEVRLALAVGRRLDWLSPRVAVQGTYSYAFVERVLGISTNRSNIEAQVLAQATRRLMLNALVRRQITHGGFRAGVAGPTPPYGYPWGDITTPEQFREHDRLMRDNNWRVGGGAAYQFRGVEVFASYLEFVGGTDTHAGRAFSAGLSVPFAVGR